MDTYEPSNILLLANLGLHELGGKEINEFFKMFGIGKTRLGFCGIRLQNSDGKAESPWLCSSLEEMDMAKLAWNPPLDSPEIMEAAKTDEERHELVRRNDAMFQYMLAEPWLQKVCAHMSYESKKAREFLGGFIPNAKQCKDSVKTSECYRDMKNTEILMSFMENRLKRLKNGSNYLRFTPTPHGPSVIFNNHATFSSLEDELAVKFYLAPYLKGAEETWKRSRICQECGNFFFYKQERARYCSQKCRMAVANRERRQK